MVNFYEFRLMEAEDNPAISALEGQIKDKMSKLPDIKKEAKEGKKGVEAKIASLDAQAKAYSDLSALMQRLSGELARLGTGQQQSTNIY